MYECFMRRFDKLFGYEIRPDEIAARYYAQRPEGFRVPLVMPLKGGSVEMPGYEIDLTGRVFKKIGPVWREKVCDRLRYQFPAFGRTLTRLSLMVSSFNLRPPDFWLNGERVKGKLLIDGIWSEMPDWRAEMPVSKYHVNNVVWLLPEDWERWVETHDAVFDIGWEKLFRDKRGRLRGSETGRVVKTPEMREGQVMVKVVGQTNWMGLRDYASFLDGHGLRFMVTEKEEKEKVVEDGYGGFKRERTVKYWKALGHKDEFNGCRIYVLPNCDRMWVPWGVGDDSMRCVKGAVFVKESRLRKFRSGEEVVKYKEEKWKI